MDDLNIPYTLKEWHIKEKQDQEFLKCKKGRASKHVRSAVSMVTFSGGGGMAILHSRKTERKEPDSISWNAEKGRTSNHILSKGFGEASYAVKELQTEKNHDEEFFEMLQRVELPEI